MWDWKAQRHLSFLTSLNKELETELSFRDERCEGQPPQDPEKMDSFHDFHSLDFLLSILEMISKQFLKTDKIADVNNISNRTHLPKYANDSSQMARCLKMFTQYMNEFTPTRQLRN